MVVCSGMCLKRTIRLRVISVGSGMRMIQEENEVILELLSPNKYL